MRPAIKRKKELVAALVKDLEGVKAVAVVSLEGLPTDQLQSIRRDLSLDLRVMSRNVMKRALESVGKGFEKLVDHLKGSCALLLLSDKGVFKLAIKFSGLRRPAFVKGGMIAEKDIVLEEGPTALMPGEVLTDLTELGVKVSPKGGKITILEPAVIVKAGEKVSSKVAELLYDMGLKPVTTGLAIIAGFEDKTVFSSDDLSFNAHDFISLLGQAHSGAFNLAVEAGVVNEFTVELLLLRGLIHARNLAREAGILTSDNVGEVMLTAKVKALALANTINWEVKE